LLSNLLCLQDEGHLLQWLLHSEQVFSEQALTETAMDDR
jgi:hypothetical protein